MPATKKNAKKHAKKNRDTNVKMREGLETQRMVHAINVFDGNERDCRHQCNHTQGLEAGGTIHAVNMFDGNDCDCCHHCKHPQGLEA